MSDVKLEPGWLAQDVVAATKRATDWKSEKEKDRNSSPTSSSSASSQRKAPQSDNDWTFLVDERTLYNFS